MLSDNQRMAEMLATSQNDSEQAAELLEKLSKENRLLRKQIQRLKETGNVDWFNWFSKLVCVECTLQDKLEVLEGDKGKRGESPITSSSPGELRKLQKERDELREAVKSFETELLQVSGL